MKQLKILLIIMLIHLIVCKHEQIPLTYAFSSDLQNKYPIQLSFNTSQTFTPFSTDTLYLYNINISMQTQFLSQNNGKNINQKVIIGLKYPSQFIKAVSQQFKVTQNEIQFGKQDYLKLIINDLSFIQSQDIFKNLAFYNIRIQYNYGQLIEVDHQQVQIIDGDTILWNQILIRRIVNNIKEQNGIKTKFNNQNNTITVSGNLQNFPKITIVSGTYLFKIDIEKLLKKKPQLIYIPEDPSDSMHRTQKKATKIGLQFLSEFSKFQIQQNQIIFKRTSQLFMLYLFLAYFVAFCLLIIILNRQDNFKTTQFVKNILSWVIWQNNTARVQVLRTQLQ